MSDACDRAHMELKELPSDCLTELSLIECFMGLGWRGVGTWRVASIACTTFNTSKFGQIVDGVPNESDMRG